MNKVLAKIRWSDLLEPTFTGKGFQWKPLLTVSPDPDPEIDLPGVTDLGSSDSSNVQSKPEDLTTLKNTLARYKELGSDRVIAAQQAELAQLKETMSKITGQGVDVAQIPGMIQQMQQAQQLKQTLEEQLEQRTNAMKAEYEKRIAEEQQNTLKANEARIEQSRKIEVQKYFTPNAKPEFATYFDSWYDQVIPYLEFEEGSSKIAKVKTATNETLFTTATDGTVKEGDMMEFIHQAMDGKYGPMIGSALKPISEATGGGPVTPGSVASDGALIIPRGTDLSAFMNGLDEDQRKKIKKGNYRFK